MEPQPIETAPDRKRVLIWFEDWLPDRKGYWMWGIGRVEHGKAVLLPHAVYRNGAINVIATHWLPMPDRLFGVD